MGGKEGRKRGAEEMAAESDEEIAEASTVPNVEKSPAAADGGVWFVLEKASLEAAKVGKVSDCFSRFFLLWKCNRILSSMRQRACDDWHAGVYVCWVSFPIFVL